MACPECPNRFSGYDNMRVQRLGGAFVALHDEGGLTYSYVTSSGARGGMVHLRPDQLAEKFPGLNEKISLCGRPLSGEEALALGNLGVHGACRPLAFLVDVNSGDDVARVFAPDV